jgi:hypothetical protein
LGEGGSRENGTNQGEERDRGKGRAQYLAIRFMKSTRDHEVYRLSLWAGM